VRAEERSAIIFGVTKNGLAKRTTHCGKKHVVMFDRLSRIGGSLFGLSVLVLPWILIWVVKAPGLGRYISVLLACLLGLVLIILYTWNPRHFNHEQDVQQSSRLRKIKWLTGIEIKHSKMVFIAGGIVFNTAILLFFMFFAWPIIKDAPWAIKQSSHPEWISGKIYSVSVPRKGGWLLTTIGFETPDRKRKKGYLYYPVCRLRTGEVCQFLYAPESNLILEIQ
jgi:hypothetical protein